MNNNPRCLYNNGFDEFINEDANAILGELCDRYHGNALTTTIEAWKNEITIMQDVISQLENYDGKIIFEYDIPRLGKRVDVVLLLNGIIFCLEFKNGEKNILENDIDQVLDYALDLKNFHKLSEDKIIVPILIATEYKNHTDIIQMSIYDDKVVNPLVTGKTGLLEVLSKILLRIVFKVSLEQMKNPARPSKLSPVLFKNSYAFSGFPISIKPFAVVIMFM